MPKNILEIVQKYADVLWWSSDPKLDDELDPTGAQDWAAGITPDADVIVKNGKRIRRWVAADSAIGPRNRGGVCIMTWADHVNAIKAQWIIRYMQPGDAAFAKTQMTRLFFDICLARSARKLFDISRYLPNFCSPNY